MKLPTVAGVALAMAGALLAAACGGAPTVPSAGLTPPEAFQPFAQRVTEVSNEIDFHWSGGNGSRFRIVVGTSPGASDAVTAELSGSAFTFVAPRHAAQYYASVAAIDGSRSSKATPEVTVTAIDVREVADALLFGAGPMSLLHVIKLGSTPLPMWPVGTRLRILVSIQAGERIRALAQDAIDDYSALVEGSVTGTTELVDDDMAGLTLSQLPPLTIAIRVASGACSASAAGCTSAGTGPSVSGTALISLATSTVTPVVVTHEMGHAMGFSHVYTTSAFVGLCMGPSGGSIKLSGAEKAAISSAFKAGLRAGSTRDQAVAAGVVLPWPR